MANILVVDDVPEINHLYSMVLTKKGHTVTVASNVKEALEAVNFDEKFDYIFLDIKMPGGSGLDFLKKANLHETHPETKVVALTNTESDDMVVKAKALGVTDYLIKVDFSPYGIAQLLEHGDL